MSLGLHHIKNSEESCSYFVRRSFGSYIIFSDGLSPLHIDFFQSKGGVYKQFIENPSVINKNQKDLFIKFGAAGVVSKASADFSEDIPFEVFSKDFVDPLIRFRDDGQGGKSVLLKQSDKKIIFLGKEYFYKESKEIIFGGEDKTEELFSQFEKEGVEVVFFSHYNWDHMVEI
jgi:hypothetical protein